jgi:hypothetical protein
MKTSLKQLNFDNLNFTKHALNVGTVYNLNGVIEFQTPCLKIIEIDQDHLTLQLKNNVASQTFFNKMDEFEKTIKQRFNKNVEPLFDNFCLKLKIKNKNFKIYFENSLFNIYNLKPGMEIIVLVNLNKLWENNQNILNYNLQISEILIKSI